MEATKQHMQHDGTISIATGRSRKEMQWKNQDISWSKLVERLAGTTRTGETVAEYKKLSKTQQDQIKDVGGFVGGTLKGGRRKADAVVWRQVLTLDADHIKGDLWTTIEMLFDFQCVAYSTHKHTPEYPRLRLVIPLARAVTPDEYQAVARRVAADIGIDFFDDTTYEPHRLMYWPSTPKDGDFVFEHQDEPWLDPDEALARYEDWTDPSYWPESSRQQQARQRMADKQGDPHEKPGLVGAFCRTYGIPDAIEAFLSDIYEDSGDGRYSYAEGSTTGGLVLYDYDKFAYSHHGTDPTGGRLVNSFDLVRIHLFGAQDDDADPGTPVVRLPSYTAMTDFVQKDPNVRRQLGEEKLSAAQDEFSDNLETDNTDWLGQLDYKRNGEVQSTAPNIITILRNDPNLAGRLAWNEFTNRAVVLDDLPWRSLEDGHSWQDSDDNSLRVYLESVYNIVHQGKIHDATVETQRKNKFHPVRDYLSELEWDGEHRVESLLIDYLGAEDSTYTRDVTRKTLTAAVKRIMDPGCKFDYVLVLVGQQGVGKSYIVKKLGQNWHSDSVNTVQGKEAFEQLQGAWLIEMAELAATRKAEAEAVKHFITKQEDSYRQAYGRQTSVFPRQCVFFGTTNDVEFLKDRTGNRRFWPVNVREQEPTKSLWNDMDQYEIDQIWAEAVQLWRNKEPLFLQDEAEEEARRKQESHTEVSVKTGLIEEYVDLPLPEDWAGKDIAERRAYIHGSDFGETDFTQAPERRERVCAMEVWVELFNGDPKQMTPMQAREINDILRNMHGWEPYEGKLRFGNIYGLQRAFIRKD